MKGDLPWRVGRQVGRTIYDAHDELIGVMDTPELAAAVVGAVTADDDDWVNPVTGHGGDCGCISCHMSQTQ